ncbi:MAG: hypothetical protein C0403_09385 [Desulfobacterium sp.]|nr:hypothetical protein [Desulfobacterium sp.]
MDKKQKILIVLAALFIISLMYRIMNPYKQESVGRLTYTSGKLAVTSKKIHKEPAKSLDSDLLLGPLLNPRHQQASVFRNIFEKTTSRDSISSIPAKPISSRQTQEEMNATAKQEQGKNDMNQGLEQFSVFGSCESNGQKYIFLERSKDIFIVRNGDIIDGQYRVENISDTALTIRSEKQGQSVTIDISDFLP